MKKKKERKKKEQFRVVKVGQRGRNVRLAILTSTIFHPLFFRRDILILFLSLFLYCITNKMY